MFGPVWRAYADEMIFGLAFVAYLIVVGVAAIDATFWSDLAWPAGLGALPFALVPRLRRFAPTAALILVCLLGLVVGGELVYRARYFGSDAITSPRAYSPIAVTAIPGFIRVSSDSNLTYTFTPGAETAINRDPWHINQQGFRDREVGVESHPGPFESS